MTETGNYMVHLASYIGENGPPLTHGRGFLELLVQTLSCFKSICNMRHQGTSCGEKWVRVGDRGQNFK